MSKTECGYLIKQINDAIEKTANNQFKEHDLTLMQVRVLDYLSSRNEKVPLKDIEAYFRVSQPTVAGIIKRLDKKSLISLKVSETNGSAKTAAITAKGKRLFEDTVRGKEEMEDLLLQGIDSEEREHFQNDLKQIIKNLYPEE